ncbi:Gfo/Idh/MocA family protein [Flavobacterium taihuense]|uniref:Gfo/Idh/MocA family oxidoreductase n=1 Tax=Flavobacterium taihuense TaxID=2857508 RepID=A0ABS6XYN3_9FLAO|nr:Gfo/Idh/MocA family oxidoreductase [Flavobacterium taihuense]MBW4360979.1 Gfo/Idh/MocA family oxidoreductase [Flavobacterium taihuense]
MKKNIKIKWGIVGLGHIAEQFASELQLVESAELFAVASRSLDKARDFANRFQCPNAYGSYDELFQDENIDILYIATPHDSHAELTIKALQSNKHVLCEKPIALHYQDALQMIKTSKQFNKFFMEAFWTRFNPSVREALLHVQNGLIGDVKYLNADFAFAVENLEGNRMTDIKLGGGSLMDVGVYPLFLAYLMLGIPKEIVAKSNFHSTGADLQTSIILQYETAQAILHSSFLSSSNLKATISATQGRINLNSPWYMTESYTLIQDDHKEKFKRPTLGKGYTYEIEECHTCIRANRIESELWSHQNSLDLITIVDEVRKQIGLVYS